MRVALVVVLFYGSADGLTLTDVNGKAVQPLSEKTSVFLFTRTDCPISNRYAPEVRRIQDRFATRDVMFWLVYVNPSEPVDAIRRHISEYEYRSNALLDRAHELVKLAGVRITPEVAVFTRGKLIYRGRIDDRYAGFGKARASATTHDLEQVLEDLASGKRVRFRQTKALGCVIEDLKADLK